MADTWNAAAIILAVLPGAFARWSGSRLLRFLDDPALGERVLTRAGQVTKAATAAIVLLLFLPGPIANWLAPIVILGVAVGGFPARRRLLDETWSFGQYFLFMLRFWIGWGGFWMLLTAAPYFVFLAGNRSADVSRAVASGIAVLLSLWYLRQHALFLRLLGARRGELPEHLRPILQRSKVIGTRFYRVPVPGGRLATAFAVPAGRRPAVAFTDTVLEALTPDEQGAVFAHELAHLEHLAARKGRWMEWVIIGGLVALGAFGPLIPGAAPWMVLVWVFGVLLFFSSVMTQNRALEEASDRRAVELCGDAATLERALIKLTMLARLPRRWSLDFEAASTHPSLSRRIQALRALAQPAAAVRPAAEGPSAAIRGPQPLVFGPHHLEWVEGATAHRVAYDGLTDLRIHAGVRGRASLRAIDMYGKSWSIPLDAGVVQEVQTALDGVDTRLARPKPASRWRPLAARILALILLTLAWFGPLLTREVAISVASLAVAVTVLVVPGLASLVAMTVVAGGLTMLNLLQGLEGVAAVITGITALVAAGAGVIALRERRTHQPAGARALTVVFLVLPAAGFWGPMVTYAVADQAGLVVLSGLLQYSPDLWLLPAALAAAVLVSVRGRLRWLALLPVLLAAAAAFLAFA